MNYGWKVWMRHRAGNLRLFNIFVKWKMIFLSILLSEFDWVGVGYLKWPVPEIDSPWDGSWKWLFSTALPYRKRTNAQQMHSKCTAHFRSYIPFKKENVARYTTCWHTHTHTCTHRPGGVGQDHHKVSDVEDKLDHSLLPAGQLENPGNGFFVVLALRSVRTLQKLVLKTLVIFIAFRHSHKVRGEGFIARFIAP